MAIGHEEIKCRCKTRKIWPKNDQISNKNLGICDIQMDLNRQKDFLNLLPFFEFFITHIAIIYINAHDYILSQKQKHI